jgi:LmbE family N-acetylglucosaminyl deacetylase
MSNDALDVIFTAPHPDDLEIGMGGTIAKLVQLGYQVGMVHMTDGEPTPRGSPETRVQEAAAAAKILGVAAWEILSLPNRELMDCPASRYALATVLRKYRPKILVGMAGRTAGGSPDHYQAQLITEGSRFYAQLTRWDERFGGTAPHRIDHLVYRPVPGSAEVTHWQGCFVVDITDTIDTKLEAISCYRSQFDGERRDGLLHYVRSVAGAEGARSGFRYGEMYALPRPPGITDMVHLLGDWKIPPPFAREGSPPSDSVR